MTEGWKCPVCGRGVAPTKKDCEHGGAPVDVRTVRPGYDHFPALPSDFPHITIPYTAPTQDGLPVWVWTNATNQWVKI